jgi:hypothetical protein
MAESGLSVLSTQCHDRRSDAQLGTMWEKPFSQPEVIHGRVRDLHSDDPWDIM